MDRKVISMIIIVAIIILGTGYAYIIFSDSTPDGENLAGEWRANRVAGYAANGEVTDLEFPYASEFDIDVIMESRGLFYMNVFDTRVNGTCLNNTIQAFYSDDDKMMNFNGSINNDVLELSIMKQIKTAGSEMTKTYNVVFTHNGEFDPPTDGVDPIDITVPGTWNLEYGSMFTGIQTTPLGTTLNVTDQKGPVFIGEMEQQIGTEKVMKTITGSTLRSDGNVATFSVIDSSGLLWLMTFDMDNNTLKAATVTKSDADTGIVSVLREYVLGDDTIPPIVKGTDYTGRTWHADSKTTIVNNKISQIDCDYTLNITSHVDQQIAGTVTVNDITTDFSGLITKSGFIYVLGSMNENILGSATVSNDLKTINIRENYIDESTTGPGGLITLTSVNAKPGNEFLGDWLFIQENRIERTGEFTTSSREIDDERNIDLLSIKDGMFIGTMNGSSIIGTLNDDIIRFSLEEGSAKKIFSAYVDGDYLIVDHITIHDDGSSTVGNSIYAQTVKSGTTVDTIELNENYECIEALRFDGTSTSEMDGTSFTIIEQRGALFKATMEIYAGTVSELEVKGYIVTVGGIAKGMMYGSGSPINITAVSSDTLIVQSFVESADIATMRIYAPSETKYDNTPIMGTWDCDRLTSLIDRGQLLNLSEGTTLTVDVQESAFFSGNYGEADVIGYFVGPASAIMFYKVAGSGCMATLHFSEDTMTMTTMASDNGCIKCTFTKA